MLTQITNYLLTLMDTLGPLGVFLATVLESFFPPIPSEIILLTAGFYANSNGGIPMLLWLCFVAALGNFVGTLPFYLVSRFGAETYLPKFVKRFGPYLLIDEAGLEKARKFFARRGAITVFVARMVPTVRSLIAFPAGLAKMPMLSYAVFTLMGSFCWNLLLASIGFWAYGHKKFFLSILDPLSNLILLLLAVGVVFYVGLVIFQIRKLRLEK
jgi:membrane protein DedA with SNARE-associated domain